MPTATATATAAPTAAVYYCPTCRTKRPAADFLGGRQDYERDDLCGLAVRCRDCIAQDTAAQKWYGQNVKAARAEPTSALAAEWRAVRLARQDAIRVSRAYAQRLREFWTMPMPDLVTV